MPRISLTRLVDFVSKTGGPKQTSAATTKKQLAEGYDPSTDFYKIIREAIVEAHSADHGKSRITSAVSHVFDAKRRTAYPEIARAYNGWWGRKEIDWFDPPGSDWDASDGFSVAVNPELGLVIGDEPHIVKLYFKSDTLSKQRIEIITHLMMSELDAESDMNFSVLDIRNRKLHTITPPSFWGPMLEAEMAHLKALWPHV